jgi:hypothetical protein
VRYAVAQRPETRFSVTEGVSSEQARRNKPRRRARKGDIIDIIPPSVPFGAMESQLGGS